MEEVASFQGAWAASSSLEGGHKKGEGEGEGIVQLVEGECREAGLVSYPEMP